MDRDVRGRAVDELERLAPDWTAARAGEEDFPRRVAEGANLG